MDVKQLQYFVVSVDMGSFHAAAESFNHNPTKCE